MPAIQILSGKIILLNAFYPIGNRGKRWQIAHGFIQIKIAYRAIIICKAKVCPAVGAVFDGNFWRVYPTAIQNMPAINGNGFQFYSLLVNFLQVIFHPAAQYFSKKTGSSHTFQNAKKRLRRFYTIAKKVVAYHQVGFAVAIKIAGIHR
jgi:hypothetical protein